MFGFHDVSSSELTSTGFGRTFPCFPDRLDGIWDSNTDTSLQGVLVQCDMIGEARLRRRAPNYAYVQQSVHMQHCALNAVRVPFGKRDV